MSQYSDNSHCRFWVSASMAGAIVQSYNVASVTDGGAGLVTVVIATDFQDDDYVVLSNMENLDATIDAIADGMYTMVALGTQQVGQVQIINKIDDGTAAADGTRWHVAGFGNQ